MTVREVTDAAEKQRITRTVLEALPEWFEVEAGREQYIAESPDKPFFAAYTDSALAGFLYLKQTGDVTCELAVMGVLPQYHRCGIGTALFTAAKQAAQRRGYHFMQVKTVCSGMYESYDRTNLFYRSLGFRELEVFPAFWDEANPCQIYIMAI